MKKIINFLFGNIIRTLIILGSLFVIGTIDSFSSDAISIGDLHLYGKISVIFLIIIILGVGIQYMLLPFLKKKK